MRHCEPVATITVVASTVRVVGADDLGIGLEVDLDHVVGHQLGAEALGLLAHGSMSSGPWIAVGEAGEVLHLGGLHEGAAGGDGALEDERAQVGPRGVDGGGVSGWARSDDHHVAYLALHTAGAAC